ncbi:uncharacterized protein LOC133286707 [Gastrolobium bilobum]|uniref:uncharacterized protein LOC133286707 n=1 Tax=Gastrolobium bilobum TaxID=150636 RepID=UPI002AB16B07|nr:uncharacterized protein LOC133286707 [Gastrolobium bilobum]
MARGGQSNPNNQNQNRGPPSFSDASSSLSMEDSASPHYLLSGDHPGLILVTHVLVDPNFHSLNRAMLIALTTKNKLCFVDGTLLRPASIDLLFGAWNRCNSLLISWLLNSVSKDIADSLKYFSNAYEIWSNLKDQFLQANGSRIYQLKQQITSFNQDSLDVNGYYAKLKTLWDELHDYRLSFPCICGGLHSLSDWQQ